MITTFSMHWIRPEWKLKQNNLVSFLASFYGYDSRFLDFLTNGDVYEKAKVYNVVAILRSDWLEKSVTKMICILPRYSASLVIPRATRSSLVTQTVPNYFKKISRLHPGSSRISLVQNRCLSCSYVKYEKPSSKIEVTVQHLKQEKDDKTELLDDVRGPQPLTGEN